MSKVDKEGQKYWTKLLNKLGLSMKRGIVRHVVYMGDGSNLMAQEDRNFEKKTGRAPKRNGADH